MKNFNKFFENATSLHKQGKINEALEIYLELQKEDNNNSQLLFQIGNAYLQKGNVELSIDFYRKVSEIDKDHFNNLNNLGGALATIGKYAEAIDVFKNEPLKSSSKLWSLPNVSITPHVAGVTAIDSAVEYMFQKYKIYKKNKKLKSDVESNKNFY